MRTVGCAWVRFHMYFQTLTNAAAIRALTEGLPSMVLIRSRVHVYTGCDCETGMYYIFI